MSSGLLCVNILTRSNSCFAMCEHSLDYCLLGIVASVLVVIPEIWRLRFLSYYACNYFLEPHWMTDFRFSMVDEFLGLEIQQFTYMQFIVTSHRTPWWVPQVSLRP